VSPDLSRRAALADDGRWHFRKVSAGLVPRAFPAQFEVRAAAGKRWQVRGLASSVESPYEMHDSLGTYSEVIDAGAFTQTLTQSPRVQLLEQHAGRSMAYTRAGTLQLAATSAGLEFDADVNADRTDVRDMLLALQDGAYDECSFAFRVVRQTWSPDYDERRITELSLDRGDVSVVNFGANPNTAAVAEQVDAARAQRVVSALRERRAVAPEDVALVAMALGHFCAVDLIVDAAQEQLAAALGITNPDDDEAEPAAEQDAARAGMSLDLARFLLTTHAA